MNIWFKILFTIPAFVQVFYTLTFQFHDLYKWVYPDMQIYYIQMIASSLLQITIAVILIRRVWSYKNVERKRKWNWTWFFIFMGNIAVLFYAWGQDKIFLKDNSQLPIEPLLENNEEDSKPQ